MQEVSHCCLLTASLQCVNTLLGLCPSPLCVTAVGCTMQSLSVNEVSFSPFDAGTGLERYTLTTSPEGGEEKCSPDGLLFSVSGSSFVVEWKAMMNGTTMATRTYVSSRYRPPAFTIYLSFFFLLQEVRYILSPIPTRLHEWIHEEHLTGTRSVNGVCGRVRANVVLY